MVGSRERGHVGRRCQNCESMVTERYARVFAPDAAAGPRMCPNCDDLVRDGATVREARANRG